ncbi:MAG: co-chaperone GroES [Gammaproteobacteria bacterium]|nr:co-chaperone GroES [Gammaproteobacteria bacterium]
MKLRPLHDRVIIKRLEAETKSAGGIVIPDTAKEKPMKGEVIAIGPGRILDNGQKVPVSVKIGDKVLIGKYSGTDFKMHDEEYVSVEEKDIIAVIEGK